MTDAPPEVETRERWQRQESRLVRPFRSADDYLKDAQLRLCPDADFALGPVIQIESVQRDRLAPEIRVLPPPVEFEELVGASFDDLRFLVSLEDTFFKRSVVAVDQPISEMTEDVIVLDSDQCAELSWTGATRVHLSVVLREDRDVEAGLARRAGSWVARKSFNVTKISDNTRFNIAPVDEEFFTKRGLPRATSWFVEILDPDLNQSCDEMPNLVKVSISKELHGALAKDESSSGTKALITNVYVDVVATVLVTGLATWERVKSLPTAFLTS